MYGLFTFAEEISQEKLSCKMACHVRCRDYSKVFLGL